MWLSIQRGLLLQAPEQTVWLKCSSRQLNDSLCHYWTLLKICENSYWDGTLNSENYFLESLSSLILFSYETLFCKLIYFFIQFSRVRKFNTLIYVFRGWNNEHVTIDLFPFFKFWSNESKDLFWNPCKKYERLLILLVACTVFSFLISALILSCFYN
jgi:hypothetical protein